MTGDKGASILGDQPVPLRPRQLESAVLEVVRLRGPDLVDNREPVPDAYARRRGGVVSILASASRFININAPREDAGVPVVRSQQSSEQGAAHRLGKGPRDH